MRPAWSARRAPILALLLLLLGGAAALTTNRPPTAFDQLYISGRPSLCTPLAADAKALPATRDDLGERPLGRGLAHTWVLTAPAPGLAGGALHLCSEYGSVTLRGADRADVRLTVTISDPYEGGAQAVRDTGFATEIGTSNGQLVVGAWQTTQGVTTVEGWFQKATRPANLTLVLEVPWGTYDVAVTANHDRVLVEDVDLASATIHGDADMGARIHAGLRGDLVVAMSGRVDATLAPAAPRTSVQVRSELGSVLVGIPADERLGLDAVATAFHGRPRIVLDPAERLDAEPAAIHLRTPGWESKPLRIEVRAFAGKGDAEVVVR